MKNPPHLSDHNKRRILELLEEVNKRSRGRPWMVTIRSVEGIVQLYEATPPVRIDKRDIIPPTIK